MWVCNLWSHQSHLILPNTWCTELSGYLAFWVWPRAALLIIIYLVLRNVNVLFIVYSGFLWKSCRLLYFFIVKILLTVIASKCRVCLRINNVILHGVLRQGNDILNDWALKCMKDPAPKVLQEIKNIVCYINALIPDSETILWNLQLQFSCRKSWYIKRYMEIDRLCMNLQKKTKQIVSPSLAG